MSGFCLISYNVLSDFKNAYQSHSTVKNWDTRRQLLLGEMLSYSPDVICLQDADHYQDWWRPQLTNRGIYVYIYMSPHRSWICGVHYHHHLIIIKIIIIMIIIMCILCIVGYDTSYTLRTEVKDFHYEGFWYRWWSFHLSIFFLQQFISPPISSYLSHLISYVLKFKAKLKLNFCSTTRKWYTGPELNPEKNITASVRKNCHPVKSANFLWQMCITGGVIFFIVRSYINPETEKYQFNCRKYTNSCYHQRQSITQSLRKPNFCTWNAFTVKLFELIRQKKVAREFWRSWQSKTSV